MAQGPEVLKYVEMLSQHFDTVGSPIMIGIINTHTHTDTYTQCVCVYLCYILSLCEQVEMWMGQQRHSLEFW